MKVEKSTYQRWRHIVLVLMVLLIPFYPKWLTPFIVINFLLCYLENPKSFSLKIVLANKPFLFIMLFYLYHIIGLLYTSNFSYAGLDVQLKLPLLLVPLTFLTENRISIVHQLRLFSVFIYSLVLAVLFCLFRAVWFYFSDGVNYFIYKDFSYFVHPGYFSMFLCFGCAILIHKLALMNKKVSSFSEFSQILMLFVMFVIAIVLLASKSGVFVLLLLLALFIGFCLLNLNKFKMQMTAFMFIVMGSVVYFSFFSDVTSTRMVEMSNAVSAPQVTAVQSTGLRIQAWESAVELLKMNPVLGTGTGDVKDELVKIYDSKGFVEIFNLRLNAHNQFLQSFAALGILGFMFLVLAIGTATIRALKSRNGLAMMFLIIIILNMLTESILEVSAGATFFAIFFAILFSDNSQENQSLFPS